VNYRIRIKSIDGENRISGCFWVGEGENRFTPVLGTVSPLKYKLEVLLCTTSGAE